MIRQAIREAIRQAIRQAIRRYGVMVSIPDSDSVDLGPNPGIAYFLVSPFLSSLSCVLHCHVMCSFRVAGTAFLLFLDLSATICNMQMTMKSLAPW